MPRILVTGASGFVGRHIVAALASRDRNIVVTTGRSEHVDHPKVDLKLPSAASDLISSRKPDVIFHCVAARHGSAEFLRQTNLVTLANVLHAASGTHPQPRVFVIGSAAEYGPQRGFDHIGETSECHPSNTYGRSKLAGTKLALRFARRTSLQITVLRLFNILGPGMHGLMGEVVASLKGQGSPMDWDREAHSLPLVRDFLSIEDAAEVCARLVDVDAVPPIVNVCTGVGRSFCNLLDELEAVSGHRLGHPRVPSATDGIIGDPSLCRKLVGFSPSPDLSSALRKALETDHV